MRISDWSSDVCSSDLLGEWSDRVQDRQSQYGVCHFRTEPGEQEISDSQLRRSISLFGYRHGILGLCASSSATWRSWCWSCGSAQFGFLLLAQFVHIEVAVGFEPVFVGFDRSEEHTSDLQSLMRNSYAVCCLKTKKTTTYIC